jgi:undecaprenyl-diphosphatase
MSFLQILILGLVQGAAELLPVSSSAHVIVAEKLMGLDPSSPEMTFLLVMLHTGTMFAVIVYFWKSWLDRYFSDATRLGDTVKNIVVATVATVLVGLILQWVIEKVVLGHGQTKGEIEQLFAYLPLIGGALFAAGLLILYSGSREEKWPGAGAVDVVGSAMVGAVQGLCLPFRGFSRSGGTISAGLLLGIERRQIEEFSFALAVVLTPLVVGKELWRLMKAHPEMTQGPELVKLLTPGLLGMVCSFVAGYLALKLLSRLLEGGHWKYFGYYCLAASLVVFALAYTENANASSPVTGAIPADAATNAAPVEPVAPAPSTPADTNAAPAPPPATSDVPVQPLAPATNAVPVAPIPTTNADAKPLVPANAVFTNGAPDVPAPATTQ